MSPEDAASLQPLPEVPIVLTCAAVNGAGERHVLGDTPWLVVEGDGRLKRCCDRVCLIWAYTADLGVP